MFSYSISKKSIPDRPTYLDQMQSEVSSVVGFQVTETTVIVQSTVELYSGAISLLENIVPAEKSIVPLFVTPRQIRLALISSGVSLNTIESGIAALEEPSRSFAMVTWEYSTEVDRNNILLNQIGPTLGFSSTDLDNLFILAATL